MPRTVGLVGQILANVSSFPLHPALNPIGLPANNRVVGPPVPSYSVSQPGPILGGSLSASGGGYTPGSNVTTWGNFGPRLPFAADRRGSAASHNNSTVVRLATARTNSKGRFAIRIHIPTKASPGRHVLFAIGKAPGGKVRVLETTITVRRRYHRRG